MNDFDDTAKEIIEATCYSDSEKRLFTAVLNQLDDTENLLEYPMDYRDASAGVSGFIYYSETEKFAKEHLVDIVTVLTEFENELGTPLAKDTENLFNWYAWFTLEYIVDKIITYQER